MGKKYKHIFRQMCAVLCACILIIPMASFLPTDGAYDVYDSEEDSVISDATGESGLLVYEQESESETSESSDGGAIPIESSDNQTAFDQKITIQGVTIHVQAAPGVFPHGATLSVENPNKADRASLTKAIDEHRYDNEYSAGMYVFDISIRDDNGNEIQPANDEYVEISFETPTIMPDFLDARVYHFNEDGMVSNPTELDSEVVDDVIVAQSSGFSYYALDFVYNELEYRLSGGESVDLQNILNAVGIQGNIFSATSSNPKLFSVELQDNVYVVRSYKPFLTHEWLDIVLDGKTYRIFVHDPVISDPSVIQDGTFSGTTGTFARQGDIATIYIDYEKIVNGIFSGDAGFVERMSSVEPDGKKYVAYTGSIALKSSTTLPGGFSYTFKDAALLQDGSTADVKVTYSNIVVSTNTNENGPYIPAITFLARNDGVALVGNEKPNPVHIGAQMDTTVEIVGASGTFYYNAYGVNNVRDRASNNYGLIDGIDSTYGWDENLAFQAVNQVYVPASYKINAVRNSDGKTVISPSGGSDIAFDSGFAMLGDASGVTATSRFASGGGYQSNGQMVYISIVKTTFMHGQVARKVVSSSGAGGRIDTNTQGTVTTPSQALTKAGSSGTTDTLAIPNGKAAIYTLTPECGYILKSLTVNGANVAVTPVKNADGKIEYYTYALPANSSNYTLHATWQESLNIKVIKKIAGNNVTSLAGSNINVGIYVGSLNMPTAADGSIDNRYTQSLTNYALGTTTPPASVNYAGLIPLTSSPQEMVTVYDLPKYTANGQSIGYQANEFGLASQGATLKKVETETTNECGTSITYTFTNEIPMVTLRVTKEVTGNAGDKTKQFPFRISYLNENIETSLRDTETYEASIPLTAVVQQSTFSVSVSEEHGSDYTATIRSNKSATVNESYSTDSTGNNQHTFDLVIQNVASLQGNDVIELVVTNDKNVPIPTGIETGVNMLQGMVIIGVSALLIVMLLLVRQSRYKQVF